MDEDTETPEPLEEYLESINRKISRTQDTFVQFYCRSSNSNYTSLAEKLCSCLPVLKDAKITHIPETITSKEQMGWIAEQITTGAFDKFNKGQNKVLPVFVNGFAKEIKELIPKVSIHYLQAYYAHTQCQGRTLETSAGEEAGEETGEETAKHVVYNFLSESGLKIVVFNVIAPEDTVVSFDGKSVDPSDLAYCSALQSDFSTTIPENYTCELEKRILANLISQNTQMH